LHLEMHIRQKLRDLDKEADLNDVIWKGKFSFGLDARQYSHLPAWSRVVQKKKFLVRQVWLNSVVLALLSAGILHGFYSDAPVTSPATWLLLPFAVMIFWTAGCFTTLFFHFRKAEREVRRLLYEDILHQLKKEEKAVA